MPFGRIGQYGVLVDWWQLGQGRDRIFEVFQRGGDDATVRTDVDAPPRRGAGVGLAVCRAIARVHGGELTLRARSGGGASFECLLPRGTD